MHRPAKRYRVAFVSSNATPWGGSEELWGRVAATLAAQGHHVSAYKRGLDPGHPVVRAIRQAGGLVHDLDRAIVPVPQRLKGALGRLSAQFDRQSIFLRARLLTRRPDLVVISQGINFDGWRLAELCRQLRLRYTLIAQKASELYWPDDSEVDRIRVVYTSAVRCYFVSAHNHRLTEDQIGCDLDRAEIIRNPYSVPFDETLPWPTDHTLCRLACPARLHTLEKGQDVLLRVMAAPKWKQRPVSLTLFGTGPQGQQLQALAQRLRLPSVTFGGYVDNVGDIWRAHHALVLPTRMEGLPISVIDAMLCGRVPIVTDAGGIPEIVDNEQTGFIAAGLSERSLDEAMERAWTRRTEWRAIAECAARRIRELVPRDPIETFAATLLDLLASLTPTSVDGI